MKTLGFALAFLLSASSGLLADPLPVRSGDHPTFSRLTVPIASGQTWQAHRTQNGISITVGDHSDGFDTESVFARMPRNRIADLRTDGDTLSLDLGCDCDAAAFISGPLLVIDVAAKGTPLPADLIRTLESDAQALGNGEELRFAANSLPSYLPWIGGRPSAGLVTAEANFRGPPRDQENVARDPSVPISRGALLHEMQEKLSVEVASATSSGLLESAFQDQAEPPASANDADRTEDQRPQNSPTQITKPAQNMRITSSADVIANAASVPNQTTQSGLSCPDNDFLPVETWAEPEEFANQVGNVRNALFNERDNLDSQAALKLARVYIYFGFGAEALDALQLSPELHNDYPELVALATIMERGFLAQRNSLGAYSDCNTDIALWATLSYSELPIGTRIDTNSTLRALNKLPAHLRHFLAPALSDRLLRYGDPAAAASALRSIERLPGNPIPDARLAQAKLAMAEGDPSDALLEDVIRTNSQQSPEALIALVNQKLSKDEPLTEAIAALVAAYAQELRGTETGNELRKMQVLALSQSSQFDAAFETLEELLPAVSLQRGREMREAVLEQLGTRGQDIEFLEHVFLQDANELAQLKTEVKLTLANRLMQLGFAAQAQNLLESIPDRPRIAARQMLAARAALQLRQPFRAQAELVGVEGEQAARLMAQAKEMTGDYTEASNLFASIDAEEDAVRAAWLSDQWRTLVPRDAPGLGPVAQVAADQDISDSPEAGPLGQANAALTESAKAREALITLLRGPLANVPRSADGSSILR